MGTRQEPHPLEFDVAAESTDGGAVLLGEVKWTSTLNAAELLATLQHKAESFPLAQGRQVHPGVWLPAEPGRRARDATTFGPSEVLRALR